MGIFDFFRGIRRTKQTSQRHILHGNLVRVDIGYRSDDNCGMTDYQRYYKVIKGRVSRKLIRHFPKGEMINFFNTYDLKPVTDFAYLVIVEKDLSNQPAPTKIWSISLTKVGEHFKRLTI